MKISERVALIRAGYTKAEIAELVESETTAEQELAPIADPEPAPADPVIHQQNVEQFPEWARGLIDAVDGLRSRIEESNRLSLAQPDEPTVEEAGDAALKSFLGGG